MSGRLMAVEKTLPSESTKRFPLFHRLDDGALGCCPQKICEVADLLGLGGCTVEEKVQNLIAAGNQLLEQVGKPRSIAALGISRDEFEKAIPDLVKLLLTIPLGYRTRGCPW